MIPSNLRQPMNRKPLVILRSAVKMSRDSNFYNQYSNRKVNLRVLVDLDQTLADFEGYFLTQYKITYPDEPFIPLNERKGFWIQDQYEKMKPGLSCKTSSIWNTKGFFKNLPPIPGAIEAVKEMEQMEGVDVFICTSPINYYKHCLQEKYHWVDHHLGKEWVKLIVLTKDKTVVNGHLLIDDKSSITGAMSNPSWEHILFSANHNTDTQGKRRLNNWTDGSWRDLIEDAKKRV